MHRDVVMASYLVLISILHVSFLTPCRTETIYGEVGSSAIIYNSEKASINGNKFSVISTDSLVGVSIQNIAVSDTEKYTFEVTAEAIVNRYDNLLEVYRKYTIIYWPLKFLTVEC